MTNTVKISELPDLPNLNDGTILPVVDNGTNKKITAETIANYVGGRPGNVGATGLRGPQGPSGVAGPSGPRGYAGSAGPSGEIGPSGELGYSGSVGPTGPQGERGESGYAGSQGELGYTGSMGGGYTGSQGPEGPIGPAGARGPAGSTGPTGPAGQQGVQGVPGSLGYTGSRGFTGATGVSGYTGSVGASGPSGASGASGPSGPSGASGASGPSGPSGASGPSGPSGAIGYTGSQGSVGPGINIIDSVNLVSELEFYPTVGLNNGDSLVILENSRVVVWNGSLWVDVGVIQGPSGSIGPVGFTGSRGSVGFVGSIGSLGYTGSVGSIGPTGDTGFVGSQGEVGYTGSQGEVGATGPQGEQGDAGPQGEIGATGIQGIQGVEGPIGPTGAEGPQGPTGEIGFTGSIGYTGSQGIAGTNGEVGATGPTGPLGYTGSVGPAGEGYTGSAGPPGIGLLGPTGYVGSAGPPGPPGIGFTGSMGWPSGLRYRSNYTSGGGGTSQIQAVRSDLVSTITLNSSDFFGSNHYSYLNIWNDGFVKITDSEGIVWVYEVNSATANLSANTYTLSVNYFGGNSSYVFGENNVDYVFEYTPNGYVGSFGYTGSQGDVPRTIDGGGAATEYVTTNLMFDEIYGFNELFTVLSNASETVVHDCSITRVFYHSAPNNNWTANFANLNLGNNYATTVTLVIDQGSTGYYANSVQIDGVSQTINWRDDPVVPSSNRKDIVTFRIMNNGGNFIVFGQLTGF